MKAKEDLPECPVATAVALIGGKWKLLIIRNLRVRLWRFNELRRDLEGISQKVLTDSLRQMEDDGLVFRHDYGENPPRVEYGLTELGRQMMPVMDSLADFGAYYKDDCFVADAPLGDAFHGGRKRTGGPRPPWAMRGGGRERRLAPSRGLEKLAKPLCPACEGAVLRPLPGFFAACQVVSAEDWLVRGN